MKNRNYPNPTQDQITIDIKGYNGRVNVEVYDLQGRLLETTTNTKVSLKKHAKGIYVLKVSYGEITEEVRVAKAILSGSLRRELI
ncbi:T9SS type A sorting domain-containing protein [Flavobacteriales bacterium]|nr:T9SS type A sorting domain-containing protein [Flavobacteriales bacterium]